MAKQTKDTEESVNKFKKREDNVKDNIADIYFKKYKRTVLGNIDFTIADKKDEERYYLWAEAKRDVVKDINKSFVQLILTIGKVRRANFDLLPLPPKFLGAFDTEKIAFVPYEDIVSVFTQNDFNWNVTPSNYNTKEFKQLYDLVKGILENKRFLFDLEQDKRALKEFIKHNFKCVKTADKDIRKTDINSGNFTIVFQRWSKSVLPTININWEDYKKAGIICADFFLADLLSENNKTIKEKLKVVLESDQYLLKVKLYESLFSREDLLFPVKFKDNQKAHTQFWNIYERPPKEEYWNSIILRRDLLVPQDIRERKGSFFTPQIWVEKSRDYLTKKLGENWQNSYYIWDCAAGTGNLLVGLTDYRHVFASTLDDADVKVMNDMADRGGFLFKDHIFQFDFLNDDLNDDKVPRKLKQILNDPEERKKLVIYINPPYAEATNRHTIKGAKKHKANTSNDTHISKLYKDKMGKSSKELFAQFLIRIQHEIKAGFIAQFSTLKTVQSINFKKFRQQWTYKAVQAFLAPANSFDNVKGKFPIGFFIWENGEPNWSNFCLQADVYNRNGGGIGTHLIRCYDGKKNITDWRNQYLDDQSEIIGYLRNRGLDIQQNNLFTILSEPNKNDIKNRMTLKLTASNLLPFSVFHGVRRCIIKTWLNDREQYLYPADTWQDDIIFINNCLAYALFYNIIDVNKAINHWIPFTEDEVLTVRKETFQSDFMTKFINGKYKPEEQTTSLLSDKGSFIPTAPLHFSEEAKAVFEAGREIWRYYHKNAYENIDYNVNASLYNIKEFFKGRDEKGIMNKTSKDEQFNDLEKTLSEKMKILAKAIEPKVYEHGFLIK